MAIQSTYTISGGCVSLEIYLMTLNSATSTPSGYMHDAMFSVRQYLRHSRKMYSCLTRMP